MVHTMLVPGLDGSPAPHWQHWWAATDVKAQMVDLPDVARPNPTLWETELAGQVLRHPGCVLVGHSLGAVLITRLLTKWPNLRIRAALLVAPAEPARSRRIAAFGPIPERPLHVPSVLVASHTDPWMSFGRSTHLARVWGSQLVDLGAAGHINVAAGFGPWPFGKVLGNTLRERATDQCDVVLPSDRHEVVHAERW
jgi:uncharacterized protein